MKGEDGKLTASKAAPEADVCMDIWMAEINPETDTHGIAIAATWNPMPRAVKSAVTTQEAYLEAVSDILISQGRRRPHRLETRIQESREGAGNCLRRLNLGLRRAAVACATVHAKAYFQS